MKSALNKTYFEGAMLYHKQIIKDFISSVSEGREPPIPGSEARKSLVIMDAIKSSIGEPVESQLIAHKNKNASA